MRFLVTGGAGFLGAHLCTDLLERGFKVLAIDNLYTGKLANLEPHQNNPDFEFIEHDVTEPYTFECDGIFNLACPASPDRYQADPIYTARTNFLGAYHALLLAKVLNIRVLQASTSEIYGDPLCNPQSENYWGNVNPVGIRSCYDEGKRIAETLFLDFHRKYGTDIRIPRIFNTYGPLMDQNDGRVVSNFIVQALKDENLTVYGNGLQTRSFCYVSDLIEGLISLFFKENACMPVNLGNPNPITMLTLANEIIAAANSSSEITFQAIPSDDPQLRDPDISVAKSLLAWQPKVSRQEGLKLTISYFRELIG